MKASAVTTQKNVLYSRVFNTEDGKEVVADLVALFMPETLSAKDEYTTLRRAHQADVIRHIQRRANNGMDG